MTLHKHTFAWHLMEGSAADIKWSTRDLTSIDAVMKLVTGRRMCVQAGGNIGIFPKYLSRFFDEVWSFEPSPSSFTKMKRNCPERNVVKINRALGDRTDCVSLACRRRDGKRGTVHAGLTFVDREAPVSGTTADMVPLDSYHFAALDLLYLDLEGYEYFALKGAESSIRQHRPVISVEINRNCGFYDVEPEQIRQLIRGLGYQFALQTQSDEVFVPC